METGRQRFFRQSEWYRLSKNATDSAKYERIKELVDIDEYINYMAIQFYLGGDDWPQNNVKGFIDVNDGKFHFVLFDMDFALNSSKPLNTFQDKNWYSFNSLLGYDYSKGKSIAGTRLYKENEFVTIFLNLLKNSTFKKKFIDTYCMVGGSVFADEEEYEEEDYADDEDVKRVEDKPIQHTQQPLIDDVEEELTPEEKYLRGHESINEITTNNIDEEDAFEDVDI